ncbi:MAG TPA: energy transducer TonB [Pyrinomonadaceae bacterium]
MKRAFSTALLALIALTAAQGQTVKQPPKSETQSQADKPTARQRAVRAEMQKTQDAFDEDRFADAELHAKKAAELDPSNNDALLSIAYAVERQYKHMDEGAEKSNKAREAIVAYQRVVTVDSGNDEAFEAVNSLYADLHETELLRSWLMQRAINTTVSVEKQAYAYLRLAWLDRDCAEEVVTRTTEKLYVEETDTTDPGRIDAETAAEIARGHQCASRGLQMAEQAIALTPEDEFAWSRKVELLADNARLYELAGDVTHGEQYNEQAEEASAREKEFETKRKKAELERAVTVDCGTLCDRVLETPKPVYSNIAQTMRVGGAVVVQIQIDEDGNVTSATVVSGHPLLRSAAAQASRGSTFTRTFQSHEPVTGTLTYTFTPPTVTINW